VRPVHGGGAVSHGKRVFCGKGLRTQTPRNINFGMTAAIVMVMKGLKREKGTRADAKTALCTG
jgi:hypothetical protein